MTQDRILVTGANGHLGQALLHRLGPDRAIGATRAGRAALPGFEHVVLDPDGTPPAEALSRCRAIINAAGNVSGDDAALDAANIALPQAIARSARAAGVAKFVQVSSFSTIGLAEYIDHATAERPVNAYGRSKAEGDRRLLTLAVDGFAVECLRLPFMFSAEKPALMAPLLALATRTRTLPTAADNPFRRSMITYADAAGQLIDCAAAPDSGKSFVADPQLFDYPLFTRILAEEINLKVRILRVPQLLANGIERILPSVGRRLFRSSILASDINRAGCQPMNLESELRQLVSANNHHQSALL